MKHIVTARLGLNIRAAPTVDSKVVGIARNSTTIDVLKIEGNWARIEFPRTGWVHTAWIREYTNDVFEFTHWPTTHKIITQQFGVNPEFYRPFGLPAHEGIDLRSPFGSPYYAVSSGKVIKASDKRSDGQQSAYGWHVILEHINGYTTLYAHAKKDGLVGLGEVVEGGQIIGYSGNTGNSTGPHLHLTLKKAGYRMEGWPAGYMNPYPYLAKFL